MTPEPRVPPSIVGLWEPIRAELNGEPVPELVVRKTRLKLSEDTYEVLFDGELADRGSYTLSPREGKSHAAMTLHGVEGPNAGRTIPAIYQLVGNRLRICYGLANRGPAEFATTAESGLYSAIYGRRR